MIAEIFPEAYDIDGRQTFRPDQRHKRNRFPSSFPIGQYLSQRLETNCRTLEDLRMFFRKCRYVSDLQQFGRQDFWMLPEEFERTKMGDCEDFAMYAWRQIMSIGHPARFVLGRCGRYGEGHAWVTFQSGGKTFLLEPLAAFNGPHLPRLRTLSYKPYLSVAWDGNKAHFYKHNERNFVPPISTLPQLVAELLLLETIPLLKLLALSVAAIPMLTLKTILRKGRERAHKP